MAQPKDPVHALSKYGVSVWLDDLSRGRLRSGGLQQLVQRGVVGVTTNPSIFEAALRGSADYADQVADLAARGVDVEEAARMMQTYDVRWACDVLSPVSRSTGGLDGKVSIEVDPRKAHEEDATVAEARGLWWLVDRPNMFVKIPSTLEGLPAITRCTAEGISVNVTLIFGIERYRAVMDAFQTGLEQAAERGLDLRGIHSVASFFVSRVDTEVDQRLEKIGTPEALALRGRAAVANARLAYEAFQEVVAADRWQRLAAKGARVQRPLWASTGVKNPEYEDTRYVDELVAPHTVNTMPEKTLEAVADHGHVEPDTITPAYGDAHRTVDELAAVGIDLHEVTELLEVEGVDKFDTAWASTMQSLETALQQARGGSTGTGAT